MQGKLSAKILKAITIFTSVQSLSIVCSVVRAKLISIWIGPVGVGLFAIFNSTLELISNATQLNINQSAVRDISTSAASRRPFIAGVVRWWSSRLGLLGAVLIAALSPLLSFFSFGNMGQWWAFAILSVAMYALSRTKGELALLQGFGKLSLLAKASAISAVAGTLISIPLYYFFGAKSIAASVIVFWVVAMVATSSLSDVKAQAAPVKENIHAGVGFVKLGVYITISTVAMSVISYVFLSYLSRTGTAAETGVYQAGYTLVIRYTEVIFTALSMEFFPRVAKVAMRPRMTSLVVQHEILVITYVLTPLVVVFVCADELILRILYSDAFLKALPFLTIGIGSMIFRAVSYCMAYVIIARADGRRYIVTELISCAIGLALNISLYHFYGYAGLGCSYVIWYAAYTLIVWVVYRGYGMRLSRAVMLVCGCSIAIAAAAMALKPVGWWASATMLFPALYLSFTGYRKLLSRR